MPVTNTEYVMSPNMCKLWLPPVKNSSSSGDLKQFEKALK